MKGKLHVRMSYVNLEVGKSGIVMLPNNEFVPLMDAWMLQLRPSIIYYYFFLI